MSTSAAADAVSTVIGMSRRSGELGMVRMRLSCSRSFTRRSRSFLSTDSTHTDEAVPPACRGVSEVHRESTCRVSNSTLSLLSARVRRRDELVGLESSASCRRSMAVWKKWTAMWRRILRLEGVRPHRGGSSEPGRGELCLWRRYSAWLCSLHPRRKYLFPSACCTNPMCFVLSPTRSKSSTSKGCIMSSPYLRSCSNLETATRVNDSAVICVRRSNTWWSVSTSRQ
mmetsp:Transcript_4480/g.11073  ORF Transcript_4480/g.11073 Transcript_4480/m.11073 type:complete len:227 (-) Transcript_4480:395-1075(-)